MPFIAVLALATYVMPSHREKIIDFLIGCFWRRVSDTIFSDKVKQHCRMEMKR